MNAFRDACARYLLGTMEDAERAAFGAELAARGTEGGRLLARESELLGDLALVAEPVAPPEGLRARVLEAVSREGGHVGAPAGTDPAEAGAGPIPFDRGSARRPGARWGWARPLLAAAAVLVVALGVWNVELRRSVAEQQTALAAVRDRLLVQDSLETALRAAREDFGTMAAPGASVFTLAGTDEQPSAWARVFVDPETGRALVLAWELPLLSEEQIYQLWALRDGVPSSIGTFSARLDGPARLELDSLEPVVGADLFAVSVEPAPGRSAPTGPIVLAGSD
ncbi:MAG: anti-sigma factor [Gemmatimonadota bacterium]